MVAVKLLDKLHVDFNDRVGQLEGFVEPSMRNEDKVSITCDEVLGKIIFFSKKSFHYFD